MPNKQSEDVEKEWLDGFLDKNYSGNPEISKDLQTMFDSDLVSLKNINRVILNSGVIRQFLNEKLIKNQTE